MHSKNCSQVSKIKIINATKAVVIITKPQATVRQFVRAYMRLYRLINKNYPLRCSFAFHNLKTNMVISDLAEYI